jgi:hypothetical protein
VTRLMGVRQLLCWLLHRSSWTILIPGQLPFNLDAVAYCPTCDCGRGRRIAPLVPHRRPAFI